MKALPKIRRRLLRFFLWSILVLTLLHGFRLEVSNALLPSLLEEAGLKGKAKVTLLDYEALHLSELESDLLSAQEVRLTWNWSFFSLPRAKQLDLVQPKLLLDLSKDEATSSLSGTAQEDDATFDLKAFDLSLLPIIQVQEGQLRLQQQQGQEFSLLFDLTATPLNPADMTLEGSAQIEGAGLLGSAQVSIDLQQHELSSARLSFQLEDKRQEGNAEGLIEAKLSEIGLSSEIDLRFDLAPTSLAGFEKAAEGLRGRLSGHAAGQFLFPRDFTAAAFSSLPLESNLQVAIKGEALGLRGYPTQGDLDLAYRLTSKDCTWQLEKMAGPLRLRLANITSEFLDLVNLEAVLQLPNAPSRLDLSFDLSTPASGDCDGARLPAFALFLEAPAIAKMDLSEASANLKFDGTSQLRGNLDLLVRSLTDEIRELAFEAPLSIALQEGHLSLEVSDHLKARLEGPAGLFLPPNFASLLKGALSLEARSLSNASLPLVSLTGTSAEDWQANFNAASLIAVEGLGDLLIELEGEHAQAAGQSISEIGRLSLTASELATPFGGVESLELTGAGQGLDGLFFADFEIALAAASLAHQDRKAKKIKLSSSASLALDQAEDMAFTLESPALTLSAEGLSSGEGDLTGVLLGPASLKLNQSGRERQVSLKGPLEVERISRADLILAPKGLHLSLDLQDSGETSEVSNLSGRANITIEKALLERQSLEMKNISLSARFSPDGLMEVTEFKSGLSDLFLPRRFPEAQLSGKAILQDDQLKAEAKVAALSAPDSPLALSGSYNLSRQKGSFNFALEGMTFSPRLQPSQLTAALTSMESVLGELSLSGSAEIEPQGLGRSQGEINLRLDSFASGGSRVQGLVTKLNLTSLWPTESAPSQLLTLAKLDSGVALDDLELLYRLIPKGEGPPLLQIEEASVAFLGGRLRLGPTAIDPDNPKQSLLLEADGLDLVSVLALITEEGLDGEGRLKGRFPVSIEGEEIVIDNALLEAEAPGVLRFASPAAAQSLQSGGDHLQLLLDALTNFRYEKLALGVNKPAQGVTEVTLSLAGHNPDLLDGYPFAINIELKTDAGPLLSALRQGNSLYEELIERVWRP